MRCERNNNLLIGLLALVVLFAPMHAAVSAIDMLNHKSGRVQHCQMMDKAEHATMNHGQQAHAGAHKADCCRHNGACQGNCPACAQCISIPAGIPTGQPLIQNQPVKLFVHLQDSLAKGLSGCSDYRPPRFFS